MLKELKESFDIYRNNGYPDIDPEIIPIMEVVNSSLFVPIYSCYGHDDKDILKGRSYLMFITPFPGIAISLQEHIYSNLHNKSMLGVMSDDGVYIIPDEVNLSRELYYGSLSTGEKVEYLAWNIEIKYSDNRFRDYTWELIGTYLDSNFGENSPLGLSDIKGINVPKENKNEDPRT